MGVFMHEAAVYSAEIFCPLVFNVDQRPLAAAKSKMLETGQLEPVLFPDVHPIWIQVAPAGRAASSTVTI